MMRAHSPSRSKLWSSSNEDEQRSQRTAFRDPAQKVEGARIGPVRIFNGQHDRLSPRTCHDPVRQRGHLPTPQFLWYQFHRSFGRQRYIQQRRK